MDVKRSVAGAAALVLAALASRGVPAQGAATTALPASSSATTPHAKKPAGAAARTGLDLRAPPLSHIYPSRELQYILAADPSGADSAEEVSVKGSKYLVPVPMGQLQAIPWAILHPTQAWRVFTPLERP